MSARAPETLEYWQRLKREAEAAGYELNPDVEFVLDLVEGLQTNVQRYGYPACPCRLATGSRAADRDIICPCDYRDPDLAEHGACYCALYVSPEIARGDKRVRPVPERRGAPADVAEHREELVGFTRAGLPVWRCVVCGYLCARPQPPLKCPICKADRDRFERFA
ncbi:MAG: ferredoxin-thioredoxin reductase catalytic domain-containing protein [Anaerolineae bacterium]